jgi:hypothetical protein
MTDNFTFFVAAVALIASALTIIAVWRKAGAIEGKILERLDNHHTWLTGHETRIQDIESQPYLTEPNHDRLCSRNVSALEKQIDANDHGLKSLATTLSDMEKERHRAREIDNTRWTKIETTLSAVNEFIESEKRRGRG